MMQSGRCAIRGKICISYSQLSAEGGQRHPWQPVTVTPQAARQQVVNKKGEGR